MVIWIRNIVFSIIIFLVLLGISYVTNFSLTSLTIWGGLILIILGVGTHSSDNQSLNSGMNPKLAAMFLDEVQIKTAIDNPPKFSDKANHSSGDSLLSIGLCLLIIGFLVIMLV